MELKELKKHMKGVAVIQVTPFNTDGSVDLEGMRANTRWLLEFTKGKDFIYIPLGSGGEFYALSEEECRAVIKMVVEEVNGQHPVFAGGGRAGTLEAIRICKYAQSVGADGAQVILPYYHVPQEEGMYLHYKTLAESLGSDFGIMIYNNAGVSGSWIKPHLMKRLSKVPNIIVVKENTASLADYCAMSKALDPQDMVIFTGIGELMFSVEALYGCAGVVSSMSSFAPEVAWEVYETAAARDFPKLAEIIDTRVWPYLEFRTRTNIDHGPNTAAPGAGGPLAGSQYISLIKAAMDIRGLRGGEPRLPLVGLSDSEKAELRDLLKAMKLI